MTWVRLDDAHQDHPKVAPLSDRSYRLWVRAISYSNKFGLDGVLSASQLRQIRGPIRAKKRHETDLVAAGLWHSSGDGIVIHDIEHYQPSAQTAPEISQKRSDAGKKGAAARWGKDGNLPLAKNAPDPTRPVPSRPDQIDRSIAVSDLLAVSHEWPGWNRGVALSEKARSHAAELDWQVSPVEVEAARPEAEAANGRPSLGLLLSIIARYRRNGGAPEDPETAKRRRAEELLQAKRKRKAELNAKYAEIERREREENGDLPI